MFSLRMFPTPNTMFSQKKCFLHIQNRKFLILTHCNFPQGFFMKKFFKEYSINSSDCSTTWPVSSNFIVIERELWKLFNCLALKKFLNRRHQGYFFQHIRNIHAHVNFCSDLHKSKPWIDSFSQFGKLHCPLQGYFFI